VHQLLVFGSAFGAGMIDSVAGGGSLLSFPTLIWLGVPSIAANATSTVALWQGSLGSVRGYRRELRDAERSLFTLAVPSPAAGLAGAILLSRTPTEVLDRLVLWQDALVMAMGAVLGGVGGAGLARRMGRAVVRRLVIAIGFGMAAALLVKAL
jgi:uncharacterized membrane protein YfcA